MCVAPPKKTPTTITNGFSSRSLSSRQKKDTMWKQDKEYILRNRHHAEWKYHCPFLIWVLGSCAKILSLLSLSHLISLSLSFPRQTKIFWAQNIHKALYSIRRGSLLHFSYKILDSRLIRLICGNYSNVYRSKCKIRKSII